ncbi:MAG: SGNH/GDSL hydrolase family protein [Mediterranea sp.]|jgi:lysophospholipase L1-like esterase|nr:SGNH/GDSL hydrolase family protein [Mediterranea sp.]
MKKNNPFVTGVLTLILLCSTAQQGRGQDMTPALPRPDVRMNDIRELDPYKSVPDTIAIQLSFPETFRQTKPNIIVDNNQVLKPIMERLHRLRSGSSEDILRIVHIGDSHVRGHIFPHAVKIKLSEAFGAVSYTDMGVNGATCLTFTHPDRIEAIAELKPELLILSFGTNESHSKRYNANVHYYQIDELVKLLRSRMPETPILLTTPPGSYESFRKRRRRRTYSVNPRTVTAVNTIRKYGQDRNLAVWDMYNIVGGKDHACTNWWKSGLMRADHIHYIADGYILQGELLFKALINTYNEHVSD